MPDVSRSDSNRSDASRPRVSFNRDVHVKRINPPRSGGQAYSVTTDGQHVPTSVQRENSRSKRQMTKEAQQLLKQVDKIKCSVASSNVSLDEKKLKKRKSSFLNKNDKQSSSDFDSASSNEYRIYRVNKKEEQKEPKNFMSLDRKRLKKKNKDLEYLSLEREEKKAKPPKLKTDLTTTSDKKQLSPIIEMPNQVEYEKPKTRVSKLVKKLSTSPRTTPPRATPPRGATITAAAGVPTETLCHNNNVPFSYTQNISKNKNLDLESTSPTNDVIYAQVVVSGSGLGSQKTTIHTRVPRNVGVKHVINSNNDETYQSVDELKNGNMWNRRETLYGENPARRDLYRRSSESSRYSSPSPQDFDTNNRRLRSKSEISNSKLNDLSLRREILLSRVESQAKERYHSLKRLQEPKSHYIGNDIKVNQKFRNHITKIPDDVELINPRVKRESKYDTYMKEKESWKRNERVHTPPPQKGREFINKIARIGKSKSFIEDGKTKMDKVKMLFRRKRDTDKVSSSEDDPLTSRYKEYKGSDLEMSDISRDGSPRRRKLSSDLELSETDYGPRKRLPTPISSQGSNESITRIKTNKNKETSSSSPVHWFKSLDRLTKKNKTRNKDDLTSELTTTTTTAAATNSNHNRQTANSNLRFFGDTDQESLQCDEVQVVPINQLKDKYGLHRSKMESDSETITTRCNSRLTDSTLKGSASGLYKYDLDRPDYGLKQMRNANRRESFDYGTDTSTIKDSSNYDFNVNGIRYGPKVQRSLSSVTHRPSIYEQRNNPQIIITKPHDHNSTLSRRVKSQGNLYRNAGRFYDSNTDDSSSLSKSTVYLHAATVGDIPGPKNSYRSDIRSQSREELSSYGGSSIITPQTRTISRSFSVLAPWRPKHRQDASLHYDSGTTSELGRGKPPSGPGLLKNKRSLSRELKTDLHFNGIGKENRREKDLLR